MTNVLNFDSISFRNFGNLNLVKYYPTHHPCNICILFPPKSPYNQTSGNVKICSYFIVIIYDVDKKKLIDLFYFLNILFFKTGIYN